MAITPGAVLEEGDIPVADGQFTYKFDPKKLADKIRTYDIVNQVNGKPESDTAQRIKEAGEPLPVDAEMIREIETSEEVVFRCFCYSRDLLLLGLLV